MNNKQLYRNALYRAFRALSYSVPSTGDETEDRLLLTEHQQAIKAVTEAIDALDKEEQA